MVIILHALPKNNPILRCAEQLQDVHIDTTLNQNRNLVSNNFFMPACPVMQEVYWTLGIEPELSFDMTNTCIHSK